MSRCWETRSVLPDDGDGDDRIKPSFRPIWCVLLPAGAVASLPASNRLAARLWSYWCALGPAHLLSEQLEHEHSSFTESTLWNCTYVAIGSAPAPRLFSPSLKTCCTLFLSVLPQSALFHLKRGGWEGGEVGGLVDQPNRHAAAACLRAAITSLCLPAADESLHRTMNAIAQHRIVLHLNVLPFSSTLHHKTQ